jgi:hypothetical protein
MKKRNSGDQMKVMKKLIHRLKDQDSAFDTQPLEACHRAGRPKKLARV